MQINLVRPLAWLFCAALPVSAWAQQGVNTAPSKSVQTPERKAATELHFEVQRYLVEGDNPLGEPVTQRILQDFTGPDLSLSRLQQAASALEIALQKEGYGFYRVTVPPQAFSSTVKLQMLRFAMGKINVMGAQRFSQNNIRASVPELQEGKTPNVHKVARSLALANENPAKRTTLTLRESEQADAFDADLKVTEQDPLSTSLSLSNTGTQATGRDRLMVSLQHANLFDRDHVISASYITSPSHASDVHQYGMFYRVPFYEWGGALTASFSHSSVTSGALSTGQTITGAGNTFGLNYTHYFQPNGKSRYFLSVGIDDKLYRGVQFNGVALAPDVRSRPLTVSLANRVELENTLGVGLMSSNVDLIANLPSGESNTDSAYVANQQGASRNWQALRAGWAAVLRTRSDQLWSFRLNGQYASKPLIAGERFGVGGAYSVRGVDERVLLGESGLFGSVEWQSSPIATQSWLSGMAATLPGLRGVLFADAGTVQRKEALSLPSNDHVLSIGAGLRLPLSTYGSFSLDAAHILSGTQSNLAPSGENRIHANLQLKF
ncbi:ShlB/FhaC/HecB family hemolysin secretion/activation protein [Ampullimonas aquatilis]|uniref:ShlB/FhaC/HecB family hemolysin secretion/activation protein n=1 Tax=Ampullimonas aquatilis TaxID=1341549 RepID=UPI003C71186D